MSDLNYSGMEIDDGGDASIEYERVTYGDVDEEEKQKVREALEKYCLIVHPDIKISTVPFWVITLVAKITNNYELKFVVGLMKHFEEFGEFGDPTESEELFGKPAMTIEKWSRQQKQEEK